MFNVSSLFLYAWGGGKIGFIFIKNEWEFYRPISRIIAADFMAGILIELKKDFVYDRRTYLTFIFGLYANFLSKVTGI